jgi:hypothetical protein
MNVRSDSRANNAYFQKINNRHKRQWIIYENWSFLASAGKYALVKYGIYRRFYSKLPFLLIYSNVFLSARLEFRFSDIKI